MKYGFFASFAGAAFLSSHTESTWWWWGGTSTSTALSRCEDEKAGRGAGHIIETDWELRSFGAVARSGRAQLRSGSVILTEQRGSEGELQKVRK